MDQATTMRKEPVALPSLDALVGIYSRSMQISLDAERLILRTVELGRLAINAEVVACKSSSRGRTFTVIAKDVSRVARDITASITELHASSNSLAVSSVKGSEKARLCEKYFQAWELGMDGPNLNHLLAVREQNGRELVMTIHSMRQQLQEASRKLSELETMTLYIPVVATMFNIETARSSMQNLFIGMGENLLKFNNNLRENLNGLLHKIQVTLALFNRL